MGAEIEPDLWVLCVITAAGPKRMSGTAARVAGMLEPGWADSGVQSAEVAGRWAGRG
jgi:hypothetical protein